MNLGETIYNLRKEKKLSQGDLAEQLSVSRQSVSKWENNSAVPDLDKLVKLSTIFGVSLDELVKGEMPAGEADNGGQAAEAEHTDTAKSIITKRFIVGMVLMGVGAIVGIMSMFLLGSIMALIFSLPFIICGAMVYVDAVLLYEFVCKDGSGSVARACHRQHYLLGGIWQQPEPCAACRSVGTSHITCCLDNCDCGKAFTK